MVVPAIPGLRRERWASASVAERWQALNDLEQALSAQEGHRDACPIEPMPESRRLIGQDGEPLRRGLYDSNAKVIYVDPALVEQDEPYAAVETTFHEARHAYQDFAVQHPGLHPDRQQVEDWQENFAPGVYNDGGNTEMDFALYRWQPVEADARKTARNRTDELYETVYQDPEYRSYQVQRDRKAAIDRFQDQKSLPVSGANETEVESELAEIGRQEMHYRYLQMHGEVSGHHMRGAGSSKSTAVHEGETAHVSEQSPAKPANAEAAPVEGESDAQTGGETTSEPSEGYDYYSGYGY